MGTEIFSEMADDPDKIHKLMKICMKVCKNTSRMYIETGVDIIAVVDPVISQISPAYFKEFVAPYSTEIFEYIRSLSKASAFCVCGNAKNNIEEMCKCRPDNISIDENIPLGYVKEVCSHYNVSVGGNIKLTVTMLFGTVADNIRDVENCAALGGKKGYILSPGCDIPFATPVENIKAISSFIHGEMDEFLDGTNVLDGIEYELPEYEKEEHQAVLINNKR